jgi:hypothetical protein
MDCTYLAGCRILLESQLELDGLEGLVRTLKLEMKMKMMMPEDASATR